MTIVIILIAVFSITLGAFGALWAQDYWRQRTAPRELKPILDWRPTLFAGVRLLVVRYVTLSQRTSGAGPTRSRSA